MKKIIILAVLLLLGIKAALAVTNIDTFNRYAWNDSIGWADLNVTDGTSNEVVVHGDPPASPANKITGSGVFCNNAACASSVNYLSFDCATAPTGNICGGTPGTWFVSNTVSGTTGNLAGYAWNDQIGWVSFCGDKNGGSTYSAGNWTCNYGALDATTRYQVVIKDCDSDISGPGVGYEDVICGGDNATTPKKYDRVFTGYAWNDSVGWISFNCSDYSCSGFSANNRVTTYWGAPSTPSNGSLTSNTFDTCPSGAASCASGVAYNSILWKGSLNGAGNSVKFQLATSSCSNGATNAPTCNSGGWNTGTCAVAPCADGYFLGPDGTTTTYYPSSGSSNPGQPVALTTLYHNNKRYYRYRVSLGKSATNTLSPVVKDVIVNWSF